MHIGGGEPFLNAAGLVKLIKTMRKHNVGVDYIETNAAWITGDGKKDAETLAEIINAGGDCIMVSADFFHIAFIPFWKVKTLINMLQRARISYFVWKDRYVRELNTLDPRRTYDGPQLMETLGYDAYGVSAREYGMGYNGRALKLIRAIGIKKPAQNFINGNICDNLTGTGHFHADLYGNYVPGGCTGMGVAAGDLGAPLDEEKYPAVGKLYAGGLKALWDYALAEGFTPDADGYVSKCDLCFSMRRFLKNETEKNHPDLTPRWFYNLDF